MYNPNFKQKYLEMESPENIVEELGSGIDFVNWLLTFGKDDLVLQLIKFEGAEMYEQCATINKLLQVKINDTQVFDSEEL
jgi:hypothetical protein